MEHTCRVPLVRGVIRLVVLSGLVVSGEVLTLGLLTPHSGPRSFGNEVEVSMDLAINKVRQFVILHRSPGRVAEDPT